MVGIPVGIAVVVVGIAVVVVGIAVVGIAVVGIAVIGIVVVVVEAGMVALVPCRAVLVAVGYTVAVAAVDTVQNSG